METEEQNDDFQRLHLLIAGTEDVKGFLDGMTRYAASKLSNATGARIECAVTLWRRKRAVTIAGSSDEAILLDGIEQTIGDGPAHAALERSTPVLLADVRTDQRWPKYRKDLSLAGVASVLGVPLSLGKDATAALNFFAPGTGLFTEASIREATVFADVAAQALRLALRIATADLLVQDLKAAMVRRTSIDLACGLIMSQNNCTQEEAFQFLLQASQNRNQKLHDIAERIISAKAAGGGTSKTYFEN